MKTKPTVNIPATPRLPIGTKVRILRPSMWAGESGVVKSYVGPITIVRIDNSWSAGAKDGELEVVG